MDVLKGKTEQHQLTEIIQLCGAITPEIWPGVENLDLYTKMELPKVSKRRLIEKLKNWDPKNCVTDPYACDLVDKLLLLDPSKRIDTNAALDHDFFWNDPMPCSLEKMLSNHAQSMFEYLVPRKVGKGGGVIGQNQPQNPNGKAEGRHEGYKDLVY